MNYSNVFICVCFALVVRPYSWFFSGKICFVIFRSCRFRLIEERKACQMTTCPKGHVFYNSILKSAYNHSSGVRLRETHTLPVSLRYLQELPKFSTGWARSMVSPTYTLVSFVFQVIAMVFKVFSEIACKDRNEIWHFCER